MKIKDLLIYLISSLLFSLNTFSSERLKFKIILKKYGQDNREEIFIADDIAKEELTDELFMEELVKKVELGTPKELDMTRSAVVFES